MRVEKSSGRRTAAIALDRPREIAVRPDGDTDRSRTSLATLLTAFSQLLLLFSAAGVLALAFHSDRLRVSTIEIAGASRAVGEQIAGLVSSACHLDTATANLATCSTKESSTPNSLSLGAGRLKEQIQQLPAVASASVRVFLPNRLEITIIQRQPEAAWVVGPTVFRVAGDGTVLDQGSPEGLRVVVGDIDGTPLKPGDHVNNSAIHAAETLHDRLPADFGVPVKRIEYSKGNGLAVIGDQDLIAIFGSADDLPLKMAELQQIAALSRDKKTPLAFVDLRYKTPYYRLR